MATHSFIALTNCKEGCDEEFNRWYNDVHLGEVVALDGIKSAVRGGIVVNSGGSDTYRYAAIYEIETDDPEAVMKDLQARAADGRMTISPALAKAEFILMKNEHTYPH